MRFTEQETEEYKRELAEKEEQMRARHDVAVNAYGEDLGEAYFNYAESEQSIDEMRAAFAEAVINALEFGEHEDKVVALSAVLSSMEARMKTLSDKPQRRTSGLTRY